MKLPPSVSPLVLTFNEAPNIQRAVDQLRSAGRVVVLDSLSTDETLSILTEFPNVTVATRRFDDHTSQWNSGLEMVTSQWVLALDADYVLTPELIEELGCLDLENSRFSAYYARFVYCVHGRPLRASLYPPRAVLFRKSDCRYIDDGHTQLLKVNGDVGWLKGAILHDDRKSLERWVVEQDRYARREADLLLRTRNESLSFQDRLRKRIVMAPVLVLFYTLFWKRLILDGWPGMYYVAQRVFAELMLSLRLMDKMLRK